MSSPSPSPSSSGQLVDDHPPAINYVLSFVLVGLAWGLTTPFIRRAARSHKPPPHAILDSPAIKASWLRSKLYGAFFGVVDLLRNPRYAVPLVLNLTGSVWFFLLIGKAGTYLSLYLSIYVSIHLFNQPTIYPSIHSSLSTPLPSPQSRKLSIASSRPSRPPMSQILYSRAPSNSPSPPHLTALLG
jgi:hypothetical protein